MKKRFTVFALIALLCLMLVGCGNKDVSNSKYIGVWKMDSISAFGESGELEDDYTLTLNGDGTAIFASSEETSNCKWQETSKGLKLTGDAKMSFTADGDALVTKILGAELRFVKQ